MIYPIGEQDFAGIRRRGLVYVDKTDLVYKMTHGSKYYFLSRPRRFGKSLLLSTLKNYFLGNKEPFQGLAIEQLETEWKQYPVLDLNFSKGMFNTLEDLTELLDAQLDSGERQYHCTGYGNKSLAWRFSNLIQTAHAQTGTPVVILIDEYDAPLQAMLDKPEMFAQYQQQLRDIYLCLKKNDEHIHFVFLTGITAWGKVGVFSALNNLKNITFDPDYATLCGITEEELHTVFPESVATLAKAHNLTTEETYNKLKARYDGYHFAENTPGVYNPFSLLRALDSRRFDNYWIETGRTLSITTLVQHQYIDINELMGEVEASADSLRNLEKLDENPVPFIFQAGYLTIKDYNPITRNYTLQVPNGEVRESLADHLLPFTWGLNFRDANKFRSGVLMAMYHVRMDELTQLLNDYIFRKGNYMTMGAKERYFQQTLSTVFLTMGYEVQSEVLGHKGRADLVVKTPFNIYIIETKLDGTAQEALEQIKGQGYADAYVTDGRPLVKLGLNFSETERIIDDYKYEM